MSQTFWVEAWEKNWTPFHRTEVNQGLKQFLPRLDLKSKDQVFVPLCGKSLDMKYLFDQGLRILGVEVSPVAIEGFFEDQKLPFIKKKKGKFDCYKAGNIELLRGDFFDVEGEVLKEVKAVYDRAALIALPEAQRKRYAETLKTNLPGGTKILLLACEYDAAEMEGPPYCVPEDEVKTLYGSFGKLEVLESKKTEVSQHLRDAGLTQMTGKIYLIEKV